MYYPIGRGNIITFNCESLGGQVNIHDQSYNSGYESLILMIDNALLNSSSSGTIIVFTPIAQHSELEEKYSNLIEKIKHIKSNNKNFIVFLYHHPKIPGEHLNLLNDKDSIDQWFDCLQLLHNEIIERIKGLCHQYEKIEVYIKGANCFKMYKLVCLLIETIGNM